MIYTLTRKARVLVASRIGTSYDTIHTASPCINFEIAQRALEKGSSLRDVNLTVWDVEIREAPNEWSCRRVIDITRPHRPDGQLRVRILKLQALSRGGLRESDWLYNFAVCPFLDLQDAQRLG